MSQPSKPFVPKFGSFKPKARDTGLASVGDKDSRECDRSTNGRRQTARDSGSRGGHGDSTKCSGRRVDDHHGNHSREDYENKPSSKQKRNPSPAPKVAADEFEESSVFIVDRRGDAKNVEYGTSHRYRVPSYHRTGYGHVIGTSHKAKIDRDASSDKEIVITPIYRLQGERVQRPLKAKPWAADSRTLRLILPNASDGRNDEEQDFIQLRPSLKRKRGSKSPESDQHEVDYRSIERKAQVSDELKDEDLEFASESDDGRSEDRAQLELQQTNASLNKITRANPADLDAWLALIEHQSKVVRPGADRTALSNSEKRMIADIRLSIYERALRHITKGTKGYEQLVIGYVEEGSLIWESAKLAAKWDEVLKANPTNVPLWTRYLDFMQTDYNGFRYEKCKTAYIQCLKILHSAQLSARSSEKPSIASARVYILLRLTSFARDVGYEEFAHALWQALLESHFCKPPDLLSRQEELKSLEMFWESDVPRIGEEDAPGWNRFVDGDDQHSRRRDSHAVFQSGFDKPFSSFARQEIECSSVLTLPAPADDDSDTNDPFRFVMFSDCRETVELLLDGIDKPSLIEGFLCFMRLPLPQGSSSIAYWADPYLHTGFVQPDTNARLTKQLLIEGAGPQTERFTTYQLFNDAFRQPHVWYGGLKDGRMSFLRFTDRVLERLVTVDSDKDNLAEYYIAYKLEFFPSEATKTAKRLLKRRPSSLRLYNAYALTEARLGRLAKAEEVWSTTSKMSSSLLPGAKDDAVVLWHSWISTLLHHARNDQALGCLLSISNLPTAAEIRPVKSPEVTAGHLLKATRYFEEGFEQMRLKKNQFKCCSLC